MTVYTIAIGKGGSTKTTTAAELAYHLARTGHRVLAIDLDQQGNLTTRLGITPETSVTAVAADVLIGAATATAAAIPSPAVPGVDVLVGTRDLTQLDQRPEVITALRDDPTLDQWDDIVIDTPPAIGVPTLGALAAADLVIAPVVSAGEAYDQVGELAHIIATRIAPRLHPGQTIHWIIPTRQRPGRLLDADVLQELHQHWPGRVTTCVRDAVAVGDSYIAGLPVGLYRPDAPVVADYHAALSQITGATHGR